MAQTLTVAQVAKRLKLHPRTVYRMLADGALPATKRGRRRGLWVVTAAAVERWRKENP